MFGDRFAQQSAHAVPDQQDRVVRVIVTQFAGEDFGFVFQFDRLPEYQPTKQRPVFVEPDIDVRKLFENELGEAAPGAVSLSAKSMHKHNEVSVAPILASVNNERLITERSSRIRNTEL